MAEVMVPKAGEDVMLGEYLHVHHRPHGRASILTVHSTHPFRARAIQVLDQLSNSRDHDLCAAVSRVYGPIRGVYVQAGCSKNLERLLRAVVLDLPIA